MSAFAARQQLWGVAGTKAVNENVAATASSSEQPTPEPVAERGTRSRSRESLSARSLAARSNKRQPPEQPAPESSAKKPKKTKVAEDGQREQVAKGDSAYVDMCITAQLSWN